MENRSLNQKQDEEIKRIEKENISQGKSRFWAGAVAGALVTAFAGLIVVGMSAGIYLFGKRVMSQQPESGGEVQEDQLDYQGIVNKMNLIEQIVDQYFLYDEDTEQVEDFIYRGMMAGLDDPYSTYYSQEDYSSLKETTNGTYSGIGAMISQNRLTGQSTIVRVFEGSPALEAGLRPGDVIYKVEGQLASEENLDVLVSNYIKGEEGTFVQMTVYRESEKEYVDLSVERRRIEVPTVEYRMLEDQTGYILVTEFDVITVEQFKEAVDDLQGQGMKQLVIDLRNNPGGVLDSAVEMADYLLPDNISTYEKGEGNTLIVYTEDKNGQGSVYTASDGHQVDVPVAVVVNEGSASASEVFTGALKDYDKALVVGTTSYGKGIVQNLVPLGDGSAIKLTTAHYYTPSGFDLHEKGITPDVEVELAEELKTQAVVEITEDNQIQAAVEALREGE